MVYPESKPMTLALLQNHAKVNNKQLNRSYQHSKNCNDCQLPSKGFILHPNLLMPRYEFFIKSSEGNCVT